MSGVSLKYFILVSIVHVYVQYKLLEEIGY